MYWTQATCFDFLPIVYCVPKGTLNLGKNGFFGPLPTEIGQLNNLTAIFIHENGFTGTIPSELGELSQLREFVAFLNFFAGNLPAFFEDISIQNILNNI